MSFLDNLGDYLRGQLDPSSTQRTTAITVLEPVAIRVQLLKALEKLEQFNTKGIDPSTLVSPHAWLFGLSHKPDIQELLREWQQNDAVVRFAAQAEQLLRESFARNSTSKDIEELVAIAIERRVGLPSELPSRVLTLELDRISQVAYNKVFALRRPIDSVDIDAYSASIRATRRHGSSVAVTPIGRIFLELTGRDALRWLLHVEVSQSIGPIDPWRVSRETAQALLQRPVWTLNWHRGVMDFPHNWKTLHRLEAFGLLSIDESDDESKTTIKPLPTGHSLLSEIAKETETPMSILAASLLSDLTLSASEAFDRTPKDKASGGRITITAEATTRQARMVAHEIRNTLVPVKTALSALYREVLLEPPSDVLDRRRERIDRGIDATFRFISQLVELSELAATPPESFDILTAIRDAIAAIEQESGQSIKMSLPESLPPVSGHRSRIVMALANVLRNATQVDLKGGLTIQIRAETIDAVRAILVTIEDNGPGIPENMRRAIFDEGFSLRPGGSGLGLALVREVFEKEMRGLVACDASSLGGARFTIRIPVIGVEHK